MDTYFLNSILFIISIFLLTIGIVALTNGKRKLSNIYLGAFFLIFGMVVLFRFFEISHFMLRAPFLMDLDFSFVFLLLPSYYFFVKTYLYHYKPTRKDHLLHSLLAIVVFLFLSPVYFLNTPDKIHYIVTESSSSTSWRYLILNPLFFIQSMSYLAYILIVKLRKANFSSSTIYSRFWWIRVFTFTLLVLQFSVIIMPWLVEGKRKYDYFPLVGLFVLLILLIWMFLRSEILNPVDDSLAKESKMKYQKSLLTDLQIAEYAGLISFQLNQNQLFLKPNFSLEVLSSELNLSIRILSEVINRHYSCSFYELTNKYRVDYCKKLLLQNNNVLTIEAIGQNAGFCSRATFYSNFKKHTGSTPSDYLKNSMKS